MNGEEVKTISYNVFIGLYYPHSLCPVLLRLSESRCPNQIRKIQTHFLTQYRLDGRNLETEMGREQLCWKPKKGEVHHDGTGDGKMELLPVETAWKIFFLKLQITAAFWTQIATGKTIPN